MQRRFRTHIVCLTGILLLLAGISCKDLRSDQNRRVLVIQSFDPEYAGYKNSDKKIRQAFAKQKIQADIKTFYLDCESFLQKDELQRMYNLIDTISSWKPEVILAYDDQATYSLMACNHPLAKQTPVIFAGVNFPNWELLKQYPNITGFWDKPELMKTVDLIDNIFGAMRVLIWMDNTYLGRKTTTYLLKELQANGVNRLGYSFFKLKEDGSYSFIDDSTTISIGQDSLTKFTKILHQKPTEMMYNVINARTSSANRLLWSLSGLGRYSVFIQSKRDFTSQRLGLLASSPTCSIINEGFGYGEGILGGFITSQEEQYRSSVKAAADILKGKTIDEIPITQSAKEYIVDWKEMERWHISEKQLPSNCKIINRPFTEQYKTYIIIFGCLSAIIIILVIASLLRLYRRENKNKQQAQENLKKGERFLSLALAGGRVFAFQLKNDIFYFDNDFYVIAGLEQRPIPVDEYMSYLLPEDALQFTQNVEKAHKGELQKNISQTRCNFNGKGYQWWEYRYTYNKEEDLFSGLCLNIQQVKEAEQELIDARRKAEESDKMKSAFLANMSHEIRTPLNAIVGFSNIIASDEVELEADEKKEFVKLINSNCSLLLKLINDILDLSRIESGRMDFTFAPTDLTELINDIHHTHQLLMPQRVKLLIETPENPSIIDTDRYRLTQVITNFINNAVKFTKEGYIKIGYNYLKDASSVYIFIEDTGIGIPEKEQRAIFERFNKLDEFAQGTGLGLSICQVIVQRFGGEIALQSEEGKGSRFTITLPIRQKTTKKGQIPKPAPSLIIS